jgi:hypothetical protein
MIAISGSAIKARLNAMPTIEASSVCNAGPKSQPKLFLLAIDDNFYFPIVL